MKKLIKSGIKYMIVTGLMATCITLTGCGASKNQIKIYNAGEYIDTSLLDKFEEEYDCEVVYDTFDSNEAMYTKLSAGQKFDILIPSDYMIERLIKEEKLQKIDWKKIDKEIKDDFIPHASVDKQLEMNGLTVDNIINYLI